MRNAPSARSCALTLLLILCVLAPNAPGAQRERQVPAPDLSEQKFFEQLRSLFGRFREGDLRRAFQMARPIECADLVSGSGEWRSVAFFNEDRKLGDWYHSSLDEVKAELSVYIFKGDCSTGQSSVQLVTKFPVGESEERYADGRIRLDQVDINVNAPVTASYDPRSQAYRFELPYLYAKRGRNGEALYSLIAPRATDRYVTNVTNRWDCKSVRASDVTFQFLICETATLPRNLPRGSEGTQSFGTYAYFIMSDGKEALTSTRLSFGTPGKEENPPAPEADRDRAPVAADVRTAEPQGLDAWQIPGPESPLSSLGEGEFRIRFTPQTWTGKTAAAQVLADQRMSTFDPARPPSGAEHCVWRPAAASLVFRVLAGEPDAEVSYALVATDGQRTSPASIRFDLKTHNGSRIGALECFFQRAEPAAGITFSRWVSIVGGHLTLEMRR